MDAAHRNRYPIGMFFRQKPIQIESLVVELNREKKAPKPWEHKNWPYFFFMQRKALVLLLLFYRSCPFFLLELFPVSKPNGLSGLFIIQEYRLSAKTQHAHKRKSNSCKIPEASCWVCCEAQIIVSKLSNDTGHRSIYNYYNRCVVQEHSFHIH